MTPNELYKRTPETETNDLDLLKGCYYDHIPEITESYIGDTENERIEIKIYKEFDFDGRRFWRLASVWLDGFPVMIIQNAGREGDDHAVRFITDVGMYQAMIGYIRTLVDIDIPIPSDITSADIDIKNLTEFYGNSLDGDFKRY